MRSRDEPLWRRYLRFFGANPRADVDDELRFHLQELEHEFQSHGVDARTAREAARDKFGDLHRLRRALHRRSVRHHRMHQWSEWASSVMQDVRIALRSLRLQPGFALTVIVVLGLGTGASTAMFSAVDAAMLRPLPFAHPDRLVVVPSVLARMAGRPSTGSLDAMDVEGMHDVFSSVATYVEAPAGLNLNDAQRATRFRVSVVTWQFFRTLGVSAAHGRTFVEAEGTSDAPRVAVLSDECWRRDFGGAPVVGSTVTLNRKPYEITGVMPPGFAFPRRSDVWIPMSMPVTFAVFDAVEGMVFATTTIARLKPGVSLAAASTRFASEWRAWLETDQQSWTAPQSLIPLQTGLVEGRERAMWILLAATGLLLLLACANVANLQIARGATRRHEIAVRAALGGTRLRIARQLFVESLLLAVAGATLGLLLAPAAFGIVRQLLPSDLVDVAPAQLDARVLMFSVVLVVATSVIFGLWPAFAAAHANPHEAMKAGAAGAGSASLSRGARRVLTLGEIALAVVLVAGSGLMLRSLQRMTAVDTGFHAEHVASMEVTAATNVGNDTYAARQLAEHALLGRVIHTLAGMPGVSRVGVVDRLPLSWGSGVGIRLAVPGELHPPPMTAHIVRADSGYLGVVGIPLVRGRWFTSADDSVKPGVMVVSQGVADSLWPGSDPIGQRVNADYLGPRTVIGVVGNVRDYSLREASVQAYAPLFGALPNTVSIVIRGGATDAQLVSNLRVALHRADPTLPPYQVRMMHEVVSESVATRRAQTALLTLFGALALILAAVGVYAVASYGVARRSREFGIRTALGATPSSLEQRVLWESALLAAGGVVVGLAGAWAATRGLSSLLYEVTPNDLPTLIGTAVVLALTVVLASVVPARRAARTSVMDILRTE